LSAPSRVEAPKPKIWLVVVESLWLALFVLFWLVLFVLLLLKNEFR